MEAPLIVTDRLRLEKLSMRFSTETYVNWMNDPEVIAFLESGGDYTIEKLQDFLQNVERQNILFWAITLKSNSKHIGNIKIDPVNTRHAHAEYGIMMGDKSEWGKGYAAEASTAVINFCFGQLNLRKINLGVVDKNAGAVALYNKLGFVTEGTFKDHGCYRGVFYNVLRMAIFNPAYYS